DPMKEGGREFLSRRMTLAVTLALPHSRASSVRRARRGDVFGACALAPTAVHHLRRQGGALDHLA
ncbi:MAG: hypothetical protein ACOZQL_00635, partial [Myxococcota bacterium]